MQKILLLIAASLILVQANQAQWIPRNSGTTNSLTDVYFINGSIGWVVGTFGTILKTGDGGTTWNPQISGTMKHPFILLMKMPGGL